MENETRKYDLDDRLLEYSASIVRLVENMTGTRVRPNYTVMARRVLPWL